MIRSGTLALVLAALMAAAPAGRMAQCQEAEGAEAEAPAAGFLMVSRGRVLEDATAARKLSQAELSATAELQAEIDAVKAELAAVEEELTRLRATLPREEFELRVAAFDQRVREERRSAQSRAALLQRAYRDARRRLVEELAPILEEVRAERGALAILNAESVLTADPSIDVTARVIELFDQRVTAPVVEMPIEPSPRGMAGEPPLDETDITPAGTLPAPD